MTGYDGFLNKINLSYKITFFFFGRKKYFFEEKSKKICHTRHTRHHHIYPNYLFKNKMLIGNINNK
jgi:hypothetical protein